MSDRIAKNKDMCRKEKCLKEINPHAGELFPEEKHKRGIYLGKPFVYEENWLACKLCRDRDLEDENG
jgi:hypothetical protein